MATTSRPDLTRIIRNIQRDLRSILASSKRLPFALQTGSVVITPVANTPTLQHVDFPLPFPMAPRVFTQSPNTGPGTVVLASGVANITTKGCDIYVTRTNTVDTAVYWMAVL